MTVREYALYENRRLYSKYDKKYVKQEDLLTTILSGDDVHIVSHESGQDVTHRTLLSLLRHKETLTPLLDVQTITSLIRYPLGLPQKRRA